MPRHVGKPLKNDTGEDPKQHVFGYNAGNNVKKENNEHLRAKG